LTNGGGRRCRLGTEEPFWHPQMAHHEAVIARERNC
jgi:hypothetical protein